MNKKEVAEIKRHFKEDDGAFNIGKVVCAFVDSERKIKCSTVRLFSLIESGEAELIMAALKKTLSGSLAKNLLEFTFPNEQYAEEGTQSLLYKSVKSKLEDDNLLQKLLEHIAKTADMTSTYAVICGYCTYSVFKKNKNDDKDFDSESNFNFIAAAFCPVEIKDEGLIYDEETNEITKKEMGDRIVNPTAHGFVYPVFSEGGADVNRVLYYTKTPKKPSVSLIENTLGCRFVATSADEKAVFKTILNNVVGKELDFNVVTAVNEKIAEVVAQNQEQTDPPVIDKTRLTRILADAGVSEEKVLQVENCYENLVGKTEMKASNLLENKTTVAAPGIKVTISKNSLGKVRVQDTDGKRYLVIDLDDPEVEVNGLNISAKE